MEWRVSFFPLDREIRKSSIWAQGSSDLLKVWLYLLLEADPRTGVVTAAEPAIAMGCNLELSKLSACLLELESPDEFSRTETNGGRRIKRIRGGIKILNYRKYATKDYSTPRVKRFRERQKKRDETVKRVSSLPKTTNTNTNTNTKERERPASRPPRSPSFFWNKEKNCLDGKPDSRTAMREKWVKRGLTEAEFQTELRKLNRWLADKPAKRRQGANLANRINNWMNKALGFREEKESESE
jgi:hypothetical protein